MTPLTHRDLLVRVLRAGGAIAAIYSFLYFVLPATTGLDLVALLNLTLASASAMLMNTPSRRALVGVSESFQELPGSRQSPHHSFKRTPNLDGLQVLTPACAGTEVAPAAFSRRREVFMPRAQLRILPRLAWIAAVLAVCFFPADASGQTRTLAPMPSPGHDGSVAVIGGIVYIVAPYNGQNNIVYAYDPAPNTWSTKASRPDVGSGKVAGVINGILYEAGGTNCCVNVNAVYAYNPATNTWSTVASMPVGQSRAASGVIDGKLYVAGGHNSTAGAIATFQAYDPVTNAWTSLTSMPTARSGVAGAVLDGKLWVIGGGTGPGGHTGVVATVDVYDPVTNTWTTAPAMPTARNWARTAVVNGILYIIGGEDGSGALNTIEAYDPVQNIWVTLAGLQTARIAANVAVVNGFIYVIGGYSTTPTLSELAANEYVQFSISELRAAGISAAALYAGGFSLADLEAAGFTSSELAGLGTGGGGSGDSLAALIAAGTPISELLGAEFTVSQLLNAGVSPLQLLQGGATAVDLAAASITAASLVAGGASVSSLLAAGFSTAELFQGGASVADLKAAGVSAAQLLAAGATESQLLAGGFTSADIGGTSGRATAVPVLPAWAFAVLGFLLFRVVAVRSRRLTL